MDHLLFQMATCSWSTTTWWSSTRWWTSQLSAWWGTRGGRRWTWSSSWPRPCTSPRARASSVRACSQSSVITSASASPGPSAADTAHPALTGAAVWVTAPGAQPRAQPPAGRGHQGAGDTRGLVRGPHMQARVQGGGAAGVAAAWARASTAPCPPPARAPPAWVPSQSRSPSLCVSLQWAGAWCLTSSVCRPPPTAPPPPLLPSPSTRPRPRCQCAPPRPPPCSPLQWPPPVRPPPPCLTSPGLCPPMSLWPRVSPVWSTPMVTTTPPSRPPPLRPPQPPPLALTTLARAAPARVEPPPPGPRWWPLGPPTGRCPPRPLWPGHDGVPGAPRPPLSPSPPPQYSAPPSAALGHSTAVQCSTRPRPLDRSHVSAACVWAPECDISHQTFDPEICPLLVSAS